MVTTCGKLKKTCSIFSRVVRLHPGVALNAEDPQIALLVDIISLKYQGWDKSWNSLIPQATFQLQVSTVENSCLINNSLYNSEEEGRKATDGIIIWNLM